MSAAMPIGALAQRTGVKVPTIRYYESIGLLPAPARTASDRRVYGTAAERRLRFIRHARELGFEVETIRQLLALADEPGRDCLEIDAIAQAHLRAIEDRIARLTLLRSEITRMIEQCAHGSVAECRVIEVLADHDQCLHEEH